jgi:hypothetical protein
MMVLASHDGSDIEVMWRNLKGEAEVVPVQVVDALLLHDTLGPAESTPPP